jgi:hypothetical protein
MTFRDPLSIIAAALMLLASNGCGETSEEVEPALPMPAMQDVLSSNMRDTSCACRVGNICANVADAIVGTFEGKNLKCQVLNRSKRMMQCSLQERFVEMRGTDKQPGFEEHPGKWRKKEAILTYHSGTGWC